MKITETVHNKYYYNDDMRISTFIVNLKEVIFELMNQKAIVKNEKLKDKDYIKMKYKNNINLEITREYITVHFIEGVFYYEFEYIICLIIDDVSMCKITLRSLDDTLIETNSLLYTIWFNFPDDLPSGKKLLKIKYKNCIK